MPPRSIELGRKVCADWVDRTVAGWVAEGLLDDGLEHLDLEHRLTVAWNEAGKPVYMRSPRRQIVSPELFAFMSEPNVIDIAEDLLGTPEVFMHGVFIYGPSCPISVGRARPGIKIRSIIPRSPRCTRSRSGCR